MRSYPCMRMHTTCYHHVNKQINNIYSFKEYNNLNLEPFNVMKEFNREVFREYSNLQQNKYSNDRRYIHRYYKSMVLSCKDLYNRIEDNKESLCNEPQKFKFILQSYKSYLSTAIILLKEYEIEFMHHNHLFKSTETLFSIFTLF